MGTAEQAGRRPDAAAQAAARAAARNPVVDGVLTVVAVAVVTFIAAAFAHWFREGVFAVADAVTGRRSAVLAARDSARWAVFLVVLAGVLAAVVLGRLAHRWRGERLGMAAVAAAAREEGPGPSLPATMVRASGTWIAAASLASVGRESAILETGASVGAVADRALHRKGSALATAGIASAFAAAYHAPIAAVMYLEEHLGVRQDKRTAAHAVAGAAGGYFTARWVFGGTRVLPGAVHPWSWEVVGLVLVGVVPAYVASRGFRELRQWLSELGATARARRFRVVSLGVLCALLVALVPLVAGNGLEALRQAAVEDTLGVGVALLLVKLVATSAAIAAGVPGGVMSPSLAVAGGAALVGDVALRGVGLHLGTARWDAALVVMAVGIAVSLRAPLTAIFMAPEMAGDLRLLPLTALAVVAAWMFDCGVCRKRFARGVTVPWGRVAVRDEDG